MTTPVSAESLPEFINSVVSRLQEVAVTDGLKRIAIDAEVESLTRMIDHINTVQPGRWPVMSSPLLAITVREELDMPADIITVVADAYRNYKWCNSPHRCPNCGGPLRTAHSLQCVECGADWH